MQAVFERSLDIDGVDFPRVIRAAIDLTDLFKYTGLGSLTALIKSSQKAEAIGDMALLADCIRSQAEIHYSRSSRELATAGFEKALRLYREMDGEHLSAQGRCTMMLGMVESQAGNYKEAIVYIEHAIELHRRGQDVIGEVSRHSLISELASDMCFYRPIALFASHRTSFVSRNTALRSRVLMPLYVSIRITPICEAKRVANGSWGSYPKNVELNTPMRLRPSQMPLWPIDFLGMSPEKPTA
jgi:tetratricopeptide (TPR) repeat protein